MCQKTSNHVIGRAKRADRKFIFAGGVGDKAKIKKSAIWILAILVINLLFFSYHPVINSSNNSKDYKNKSKNLDLEDLPKTSTTFENLTINSGDELYEDRNYDFNVSFYDSVNKTKEYNATLQTKLIGDDTIFNDSISNLNNSETQVAYNDSISMINGTSDFANNMTLLDGNYTTYNSTLAGYYLATYSFENDANGGDPAGWTDNSGAGCDVSVIAELGGHKKVVELDDQGADICWLHQDISATYGSIEFWIRTTDANKFSYWRIQDGVSGKSIIMKIDNNNFYYHDGAYHIIRVAAADTWYHLRITFDCGVSGDGTNDWHLWIDGVEESPVGGYNFRGAPTELDYIQFITDFAPNGYKFYLDAIGYSWDGNYSIGDNFNMVPCELNFTLTLDFANYDRDLLVLEVFAYYYTSILQLINFSIWNFTSGEWFLINSSSNDVDFYLSYYMNDTNAFNDFLNGTGGAILNFYGMNITSEFQLFLDYCGIKIYYKLELSISKSFNIKGNWKYRFYVVGSNYYSSWIYFEIINQIPNFEGISESEYTTRWILLSNDSIPTEKFHDDLDGVYFWDLYNIPDRTISTDHSPTDDAYVVSFDPNGEYGWDNHFKIVDSPTYDCYGFIKWEYPYLDLNTTANSIFRAHVGLDTDNSMKLYSTDDFDENTITWNNMPAEDVFLNNYIGGGTGWKNIPIDDPYYYYLFKQQDDVTIRLSVIQSKERLTYEPTIQHHFAKNYHGNGMVYIQTDEIEILNLRSGVYGTVYNLTSGDSIKLDVQSTAPDITLKFYLGGVEQKEITILSGNINSNNQTIELNLDEDISFDQLMFSGTFHDPEHFICYDILVEKYVASDVYEFYVDPDGQDYLYGTPGDYTLKIYELVSGSFNLKITKNITLTFDLFTEIYVPEVIIYHYLKLYHYAYEMSTIEIYGPENKTLTASKDEIIELLLIEGDYTINWTNGENGEVSTYNIHLSYDRSLVFPSTYTTIYFSLYNFDGFGIDRNLLRFYINNSRKDFGFNTIRGSYANLVVNDYWSFNLYNRTVQINDTTFEFDIQVEIYTLIINNNYSQQLRFEIYREGLSGNITQYIPAHYSWPFMFYPNVKYRIRAYYINGTFLEEKEILLTENFQEVDFGFHKEPITDIQFPTDAELITNIILIIVIFSLVVVVLSISIIYVVRRNKKLRNQPVLEVEQQGKGRQSEISLRKKLYT